MKHFFICLVSCLAFSVFSQQGKNYLKLMNDFVIVDSTQIRECYKNGKPKLCGLIKYYQHGDYIYELNVGKHTRYYRNGARTVSIYDEWGTNLLNRYYDCNNNLISQSITTLVETTASNLDEFLENSKHITFKTYFEDYAYDNKLCKYYLKKSGYSDNGKKEGVWKVYFSSGKLKKEKVY